MLPALSPGSIAKLLEPYVASARLRPNIYTQLVLYLELILKWNARVNLTAIRDAEEIVRRHFGESLFAGLHLGSAGPDSPSHGGSLLDLGSGAGFPGIPIQLLHPDLFVTLAESQSRKAAFLREALRTLDLPTEVWADRAEVMPGDRRFDTVALRAVDGMGSAVAEAARRAARRILILGTRSAAYPALSGVFDLEAPIPLPGSSESVLWVAVRSRA